MNDILSVICTQGDTKERGRGKGGGVAGLTELVASVIIQTICQASTGKAEREREKVPRERVDKCEVRPSQLGN